MHMKDSSKTEDKNKVVESLEETSITQEQTNKLMEL